VKSSPYQEAHPPRPSGAAPSSWPPVGAGGRGEAGGGDQPRAERRPAGSGAGRAGPALPRRGAECIMCPVTRREGTWARPPSTSSGRSAGVRHRRAPEASEPRLPGALCAPAPWPGERRHRLVRRHNLTLHKQMGLVNDIFDEPVSRPSPVRRPSATCATRPPGRASSRTPSRSWWSTPGGRWRWPTTAPGQRRRGQGRPRAAGLDLQSTMDSEIFVHLIAQSRADNLVSAVAEALAR